MAKPADKGMNPHLLLAALVASGLCPPLGGSLNARKRIATLRDFAELTCYL
jgi:hypothetical protein